MARVAIAFATAIAAAAGLAGAALLTALPPDTHERGRQIYNFRCYFCHGYSGDAKTLAATYLNPPPRDFTAAPLTHERIALALREGRTGTAMASFRRHPERRRHARRGRFRRARVRSRQGA